ncbi:THAP domain-containing protein 1 [Solenopsis invicta]|uniref:THAP domain-containing protein 1 n=1 Tax=Solenopsis invicta TaxID=13686 RepID=UPI000595B357|nr:THAP domain-containing protein 1 [Solenopsis invicta]
MVKACCVKNCKSSWFPGINLSFFCVPFSNKDLFNKWVGVIPSKGPIGKYSVICSEHFKDYDFKYSSGKRFLKKNVVPSSFSHDVLSDITLKSNITTSNLTQDVLHLDHIYSTSIILKEETVNTMNECEEDIKFKDIATQTKIELKHQNREHQLKEKIRCLQNKLRRREKRIDHMTALVKVLKRKLNAQIKCFKRMH